MTGGRQRLISRCQTLRSCCSRCVCVCVCVCGCCMYICMHACMYIYIYVCIIYTYIHTCTHTHRCIYTCTHTVLSQDTMREITKILQINVRSAHSLGTPYISQLGVIYERMLQVTHSVDREHILSLNLAAGSHCERMLQVYKMFVCIPSQATKLELNTSNQLNLN
jgi:hypothetical protein